MRHLIGLLLLAVLAAACGSPEIGAAPSLELGRDICEECGMIISDERFASGFVDEDGDHVFDDIGGLLTHLADPDRLDEVVIWVKDHGNPQWIEAESAHFVRGVGIRSPMEFGIAGFAEHEDAMAYAEKVGGTLVEWPQLKKDARTGMISAHDHDDMEQVNDEGDDEHDH